MAKYFQYDTIVAGSNLEPLTIELRNARNGLPLPLSGATITITIRDETTGEVIADESEATPNASNPYWVDYYLSDDESAKITTQSTWLAQWTLTAGTGKKHLVPTIGRIPVRPREV